MKKIPEFNIEREVRGAMRRVFVRTPARREALMAVRREVPKFNGDGARSKKDSVQYQCALCQNWIKSTEVSVDHIVPVVSIDESFIDYNTFAARLFCSKENLQVACLACHEKKTLLERLDRLIKQYTRDLDSLTLSLAAKTDMNPEDVANCQKKLVRLVATKKTKELVPISERASALLIELRKWKASMKTPKTTKQ